MERYRIGVYLPRDLDGVVRRNRHKFEVGLATPAEIAEFEGSIDVDRPERGRIDDWHLVAFRDRVMGLTSVHVLGDCEDARIRFTSDVSVIAADRSRVRTRNSLYDLGEVAESEPDLARLLFVGSVLRHWGIDDMYDLGVTSA